MGIQWPRSAGCEFTDRAILELFLDCWNQFGYRGEIGIGNGGLSTLEDLEWVLREAHLLDKNGLPLWDNLKSWDDNEN